MTLLKQILSDNEAKIRAVVLTDQEKEAAHFEGQKKKYFKDKHKDYWNDEDSGKGMEAYNVCQS